jgi:hypothetical protein
VQSVDLATGATGATGATSPIARRHDDAFARSLTAAAIARTRGASVALDTSPSSWDASAVSALRRAAPLSCSALFN